MRKLLLAVVVAITVLGPGRGVTAGETAVRITRDGLTLNGTLSMPDGRTVKDGVVLITHGTLGHNGMEVIKAMQGGLAERGIGSLAITLGLGIDNRMGMYDCAVPHRHTHTDALAEIGAWLDWLKAQGADKVVLMGHSRGGNQTAWFAAERPDPVVKKVVLLAPMTWKEEAERAQYKARYGKPLEEPLAKATAMTKAGQTSEMMTGIDFLYCPAATVTAAAFIGYYQPDPRFDTPSLLPRIAVPTLVVAAADDEVVKGLPEAVGPLADAGKVRLVVVPDADHTFRDFAAEDAVTAIKAFLAD